MSDLPASRPARPGIPRNAEPTPKSKTSFGYQARAKDTPDADCLPARRSSTEVTKAMAQLSSILGGKPGRPGDMLAVSRHGRHAHQRHRSRRSRRKCRNLCGRGSQILETTRPTKTRIRTSRESMPRGSWIPGWACDVGDYRHGSRRGPGF